jgi:hypothetical protein
MRLDGGDQGVMVMVAMRSVGMGEPHFEVEPLTLEPHQRAVSSTLQLVRFDSSTHV